MGVNLSCECPSSYLRETRTDDNIRTDLAPLPGLALLYFLDDIDLRIVEDLISVRGGYARLRLLEGRIELDLVLVAENGDSICLWKVLEIQFDRVCGNGRVD